jgi:hypothetical protein
MAPKQPKQLDHELVFLVEETEYDGTQPVRDRGQWCEVLYVPEGVEYVPVEEV